MEIKIEDYGQHRVFIKQELAKKGLSNYKEIASSYAALSSVPVYCCYYYLGELIGFNPWLVERMEGIAKFYAYTKITTKESSSEKI